MPTITRNRRKTGRVAVPGEVEALVGFRLPQPQGPDHTLELKDLSAAGISFTLREAIPGLEVGTTVRGATVRVGEHEVRGQFVVMHLTPANRAGATCGALFYGNAGRDLSALVASLEAND